MASVYVKPIAPVEDELRHYIKFINDLYKGNPYFIPPLYSDWMEMMIPEHNPSFEFCDAQYFMAYRNGEIVGVIGAMINKAANEKFNQKVCRFGMMDFIDDEEVVDELINAVTAWGKEQGMTELVGPMGFTDMDPEGMLIEGFEEIGTQATIYNYPYYRKHMERLGFVKDADWVEYRITIPDAVPEKYQRIADIVARKYDLRVLKYTSRKKIAAEYGHAIFELINEAYKDLFGFVELTPRQIDHYIGKYLGVLRLEDVVLIVDKDSKLIALGISMPSLSTALQKCGGKMWPFGWYHLLNAINGKTDVVDLLLIAVKPEYQSKGVNALLFSDLIPRYNANGYKFAESNVELEGNENVQKQWEYFERRQHRRRRAWKKDI